MNNSSDDLGKGAPESAQPRPTWGVHLEEDGGIRANGGTVFLEMAPELQRSDFRNS